MQQSRNAPLAEVWARRVSTGFRLPVKGIYQCSNYIFILLASKHSSIFGPTFARIQELESRAFSLESLIVALRHASQEQRDTILESAVSSSGKVTVPSDFAHPTTVAAVECHEAPAGSKGKSAEQPEELSISDFVSPNATGDGPLSSFGPSSALHVPGRPSVSAERLRHSTMADSDMRNVLIANAALQRQLEHQLSTGNTIQGVPANLALRLLDCHWSRQHHTFLLTYRPAIMRDLRSSGPNASPFLINAIFACSSKYAGLVEVREDPTDPATAGNAFFIRCDELLNQGSLLAKSAISTVVGLLLLGSTYNARGEPSKGWLYSGYALRMVYDLGLHLDPTETTDDPEEIEIRRRVFWGAFVCDKLQSLYLGRPVAINVRDSRVSQDLFDYYEEMELYSPAGSSTSTRVDRLPIRSVSTFRELCVLSQIMTTIINAFYVIGAPLSNLQGSLQAIETALAKWKCNLAKELDFEPWMGQDESRAPNILILHGLYHTLIILLHRPFISNGHVRSAGSPVRSWEKCSEASRRISHIVGSFRTTFTLTSAPYVLGYAIYVACTIHVRNVASLREHASLLIESMQYLEELCVANPGISKPRNIIKRMMVDNGLNFGQGKLITKRPRRPDTDTEAEEVAREQSNNPMPTDCSMDDIINMFPASELSLISPDPENGLYPQLSYDPLFGFMDTPL